MTKKKILMEISKLDSAKRELEHAIRLFFNDGDVVVIHLVASSAYSILRDSGRKQGAKSNRDELMKSIKKDKQAYVASKLNEAYNYFHHANKDDDRTIVFNPELTELVLWDSCSMYKILTHENTGLMLSYNLWFYIKHKDAVLDSKFQEAIDNFSPGISITDKQLFLNTAEIFENKRAGK